MTSPSAGSGPSGPPDKQHHKLGSVSGLLSLRAANHAGIAVCNLNRDCESGLPKGLPQAPSASCPRAVALGDSEAAADWHLQGQVRRICRPGPDSESVKQQSPTTASAAAAAAADSDMPCRAAGRPVLRATSSLNRHTKRSALSQGATGRMLGRGSLSTAA